MAKSAGEKLFDSLSDDEPVQDTETAEVPGAGEAASPTDTAEPAPEPLPSGSSGDGGETVDAPPATGEPEDEFNLASRMREAGFENLEDSEAASRLFEAYHQLQDEREETRRRLQELEYFADQGREYLHQQRASGTQQFDRSKDVPEPAAEADGLASEEPSFGNPHRLEPGVLARYQRIDRETGAETWAPDTPPSVKDQAAEAEIWQRNWADKLLNDPGAALQPIIDHYVGQRLHQIEQTWGFELNQLPQRLDVDGSQGFLESKMEENQGRFYQMNPVTGALDYERPTAYGQEFAQQYHNLSEIADVRRRWEIAERMAAASLPEHTNGAQGNGAQGNGSSQPAQETPEQTRARRQKEFRQNSSASGTQRTGTEAEPSETRPRKQNRHVSRGAQVADLLGM